MLYYKYKQGPPPKKKKKKKLYRLFLRPLLFSLPSWLLLFGPLL